MIPITSSALSAYHGLVRGDEDASRGCAFFAVTGFLSIPLSIPMLLSWPYTLLCDEEQRVGPDWVQRFWGTTTTNQFFATTIEGGEKLKAVASPGGVGRVDAAATSWIFSVDSAIRCESRRRRGYVMDIRSTPHPVWVAPTPRLRR